MASVRRGVTEGIGNTPMVELSSMAPPNSVRILVKLESANPTGSMKDRMARAVIDAAGSDGRLAPGDTVVEYTAGTTGLSLAMVCAAKGYRLHVVFSDAFSEEKRRAMLAYGATITDVQSDEKKITNVLIKAMIARAKEVSGQPNHWWCDQLNNRDAISGYHALGEEIWRQSGERVDAFVHMVGTAHSLHGATKPLRAHNPNVRIVAVEPAESAVLSGGPSGAHKIEGTGLGFVPPLWEPSLVDEIVTVSTTEARETARRLAREEGIFGGVSSGANVAAALRLAERMAPGTTVATLIVDSGFRYLSTDLYAQ